MQDFEILELGIQFKETGIPVTIEIRNPASGIQNPRLSWITLHVVIFPYAERLLYYTKSMKIISFQSVLTVNDDYGLHSHPVVTILPRPA